MLRKALSTDGTRFAANEAEYRQHFAQKKAENGGPDPLSFCARIS